jgi:exodeoxyribonuclease VII large subunit
MIERLKTELRGLARGVPSLDSLLAMPRQRLDASAAALPRALRANAHAHRVEILEHCRAPYTGGRNRLSRGKATVCANASGTRGACRDVILQHARRDIEMRKARITSLGQLLKAFSHKSVLDRGFALVRGSDGHPLRIGSVSAGPGTDTRNRAERRPFRRGRVREPRLKKRPRPRKYRNKAACSTSSRQRLRGCKFRFALPAGQSFHILRPS